MKGKSGGIQSKIGKDLDSSIDGVADGVRLNLPYAKANRWDPRAGVEHKGFGHV